MVAEIMWNDDKFNVVYEGKVVFEADRDDDFADTYYEVIRLLKALGATVEEK